MEAGAQAGDLESGWAQFERVLEEHGRVVLALNAQTVAA
jgi:hypothetical protein